MFATVMALYNLAGLTSSALHRKGLGMMRRIMLLGTVALVAAAMIVASALPTFAKQAKPKVEGQQVGEEGTCTAFPGTEYPTIQSAGRPKLPDHTARGGFLHREHDHRSGRDDYRGVGGRAYPCG